MVERVREIGEKMGYTVDIGMSNGVVGLVGATVVEVLGWSLCWL